MGGFHRSYSIPTCKLSACAVLGETASLRPQRGTVPSVTDKKYYRKGCVIFFTVGTSERSRDRSNVLSDNTNGIKSAPRTTTRRTKQRRRHSQWTWRLITTATTAAACSSHGNRNNCHSNSLQVQFLGLQQLQ